MKEAKKKGNVNVYLVFKNYKGDITEETLVATFLNKSWALAFLKSQEPKSCYDEYTSLELREV